MNSVFLGQIIVDAPHLWSVYFGHTHGENTVQTKTLRVFRNHYICEECPNEFNDELLVSGPSWCPCCDKECEPYFVEEFEQDCLEAE